MICTSIQHKNLAEIQDILESGAIEMAEIRLDRCPLSMEDIEELFSSSDVPLLATCRMQEAGAEAEARLTQAIVSGAKYADLELEAPTVVGKRIRQACTDCGTLLIRSYHNYLKTSPKEVLAAAAERCINCGADIVKIATLAENRADADRVLSLYRAGIPRPLIAFAMGYFGEKSRIGCLRCGAPFTYAALTEEEAAAPGQREVSEVMRAVYGDRKFIQGRFTMPASKSFAQRAILSAALSDGVSHLSGYSACGDSEAALAAARAIGAEITKQGDKLTVKGIAAGPGRLSLEEIPAGESGLLTRLLIPLLSVLNSRPVKITGERTLLERPLDGVYDGMAAFGVSVRSEADRSEAARFDCLVPLTVQGPLLPGQAEMEGAGGSQLISGLLMALPLCEGNSILQVEEPKSLPYLFITAEVLRQFGVEIAAEMEGEEGFAESRDWSLCTGITFRVKGRQRFRPADFQIEGDWSGAANFLVAGAVFGSVDIEGLDPSSLQGDITILDILSEAGASLSIGEDDGVLHVQRAPLTGFEADLNNCPDLFPIVAVLSAFCQGRSRLLGLNRLARKESDRGQVILEMLTQMGVRARAKDDELQVDGMSLPERLLNGKLLSGGIYSSHHDHRIAMALKVASLGADNPIVTDDEACVEKSFPAFHALFDSLLPARP